MRRRIPDDIRAAIHEWDRRRRELGSNKTMAARYGISESTVDLIIREGRMDEEAARNRREREQRQAHA